MKNIFVILLFVFATTSVLAQVSPPITGDVVAPPTQLHDTDEYPDGVVAPPDAIDPPPDTNPYMFAEEMPMFPGGDSAWKAYVRSMLSYPPQAIAAGEQGVVYVQFVVETDGSITGCIVRRHPNSQALADEALRVMSHSPKWIPGKMNGKAVRVQMIMPIRFVLPD